MTITNMSIMEIFKLTEEQNLFLRSTIPMTLWQDNRTLIERVRYEGIYNVHEKDVLMGIRKEYIDNWYGVPEQWWSEENPRKARETDLRENL